MKKVKVRHSPNKDKHTGAERKNNPKVKNPVVPPSSRKANKYFVLFFFICSVVLYGNTVLNKFAIDDEIVTHNELVKKGLKAIPAIFSTTYYNQVGNIGSESSDYRPIVKLTFALEYQFLGERPGMSHIINLLIYFCISCLLFFILKNILKKYNILFPFLITLLFMVHPVHTEVVASLKNRDEMLAFLCGLGTLWFVLKYAEKRKIRYVVSALVVFFIGYLCKSSILPFLLIIPLVLYFFTELPLRKYLPIIIAILVIGLIAQFGPRLFLPFIKSTSSFIENPLYFESSLWIRLGTAMMSLLFYIKILIYPYPLVFYYGFNMIPVTNLANIWVWISIVLYGGMLLFAVLKFREKHFLSFAILWYLIGIAMYSNLVVPVVGIVAERFVFLSSAGFCMAVVYAVFTLFRTNPKALTIEMDARLKILAVIILLTIPCTVLTISRNPKWKNLFTLYFNDIKHLDNSVHANIQYAGFLMRTVYTDPNFQTYGRVNEFKQQVIISHLRQALKLYPLNYQVLNDLGTVYLYMTSKPDSAVYFLKKAIDMDPDIQPAWVNLGMAYRQMGEYQKAIDCYNHILQINPNQIKAIIALSNVYYDMGDFNRAVSMNEEMMRKYPNLDMPYINIGNYYIREGDTVTAVRYWEQAAARNPSPEVCTRLNQLYRMRHDVEKADYYYQLSLKAIKQIH